MKWLWRVIALLCLSTLVFAATTKTFTWIPPTEYEPDPDTGISEPLSNDAIQEYRIYCDGGNTPIWTQPNIPLDTDTWVAPSSTFAVGTHLCNATAVSVLGEESARSNTVNFTVAPLVPKAPVLAVQ